MNGVNSKKTVANVIGVICFFVFVIIDQVTKTAAVANLKDQQPHVLVDNVFELFYLENRGAAFGILQGQKILFVIITIAILAVIFYVFVRLPATKRFYPLRVLLVLVAAGAFGNFIDRTRQGYVVDFFYFKSINFPIFNVADIYVTVSTFVLLFVMFFYYKEEDLERVFSHSGK